MTQIGRFFSLQKGRVGQYLSPRVLVVRSPFQPVPRSGDFQEVCYFGFEHLSQVQKFARYLSGLGCSFQIHQRKLLRQYPYEVKLLGRSELARMLAYWERTERPAQSQPSRLPLEVTQVSSLPGLAA